MKLFLVFSCSLLLLVACSKENNPSPGNGTTAYMAIDLSYGSDSRQKMDIYLPAGRTEAGTKTMILIHGGGWSEGDKNDMRFVIDSLRKRLPDYAFVNINYRLASGNTVNLFPTQENDVKAAIDFYLSHSVEYKVSKDLVIAGASAGGHLALLYGYKDDTGHHVKTIVDYFGPTDLQALWNAGLTQQLILYSATGKFYDQDPTLYQDASPLNFISEDSPPTIVIQGGADLLVLPAQSSLLIARLQEKTVVNQLVYYSTGAHGDWPLSTYSDSFEKIQQFIAANVH